MHVMSSMVLVPTNTKQITQQATECEEGGAATATAAAAAEAAPAAATTFFTYIYIYSFML